MADFLAHELAEAVFQFVKDHSNSFDLTQAELGTLLGLTIERLREQQPNELRPRADLPCFLWSEGEHRWDYTPTDSGRLHRCLCGAVRLPEGGFRG